MKQNAYRPWWWWINPWLYIQRRDRAYNDALDSLQEMSIQLNNQKSNKKPWNDHVIANEDDVFLAKMIVRHLTEKILEDRDRHVCYEVPFVAELLAKLRVHAYNKGLEQHSLIAMRVGFEAGLVAGRDIAKHEMEQINES